MAKRRQKASSRRSGEAAALTKRLLAFFNPAGKVARPFPCFFPFATFGEGVVNIPARPPNAADARLARTRAIQDSEAAALAICRTNPNCPNVMLLAIPIIRFFLRVRAGRRSVICRLIGIWMCVPWVVPPPEDEDLDVKP